MEGAEAIGDAVTGGVIARSVEPKASEAAHASGGACLNCGTVLVGDHCHRCGQAAHVHRTIGAFVHDLVHGVLHLDGKIWRTLPLLAWRPGELTRRYAAGERARFVSPMALFLFSVFLMFAVVNALGGPFDTGGARLPDRAEVQAGFNKERAESLREIEQLRGRRQQLQRDGRSTTRVDRELAAALRERKAQDELYRQALGMAANTGDGAASDTLNIDTGLPFFNEAIAKAGKNPELLLYKVQTNAYKFSWALIPISVPFLWLLFLHRRRYRRYGAYDHVVFVTYSIAFMTLGFVVLSLLRPLGAGETLAGLAITFVPPIHMYRQLRGAYLLSRWSALWRTAVLLLFAFVASSLFLSLIIAAGL